MKLRVSDMPKSTGDAGFHEGMFHMYIINWQGMRCCWISIGCVISSSTDPDVQIFTFLFRVGRVGCISVSLCNH